MHAAHTNSNTIKEPYQLPDQLPASFIWTEANQHSHTRTSTHQHQFKLSVGDEIAVIRMHRKYGILYMESHICHAGIKVVKILHSGSNQTQ